MIKGIESILLFSQNARKLADFYREKVGLKMTLEAEMGEAGEQLFGFEMEGNPGLYISDHSKVKGQNKEPERIMFNLEVDDIEKEVKRLKEESVEIIQDVYHVENYGLIATFKDVDGNYFQFVQIKES